MLAALQKLIVVGLLLACFAVSYWSYRGGALAVAIAAGLCFALLCQLAYAGILGIEFSLARRVNARALCYVPAWPAIASAWWHEVCAGPQLFCWRQPFRSNAFPDRLISDSLQRDQQGVVLVHGLFCNRAFWSPWLRRLTHENRMYVAVNLEPVFGSIGTPHLGTWLAKFGRSDNAGEMRPNSEWLERLGKSESVPLKHHFTCWYSTADNITMPSINATMPGADNRELHGVAHVQMAFLPRVMEETLELLENSDKERLEPFTVV